MDNEEIKEFKEGDKFVVDTIDDVLTLAKYLKDKFNGKLKIRKLNEYTVAFDEKCSFKLLKIADKASINYEEDVDNPKLIGID